MAITDYAMVSRVRFRELKTRIGLAAFIASTSAVIAPGLWPALWFLAVLVSQFIDWAVFRIFILRPYWEPGLRYKFLACATTFFSVAIYSAITAYLWFAGGEVGRLFALVQIAGGLLHVSLHMYYARPILIAAAATHGAYFLALPIATAVMTKQWPELLVVFACILYMSHLVVAVRQSSSITSELQAANQAAEEARKRAEIANAAKSDFLAVISHEIRTPMNAVISAANLLKMTELEPQQREHVSMLVDAGDVLMGLLNDVLDFSKIEAGKMEVECAEMVVRERLTVLNRLWEARAQAAGVRLVVGAAPEVPVSVMTDPLRFQQILFNLISNALKFTRKGRVTVDVKWESSVLCVTVADTGCGIPGDRLAYIFNSFEQADAGTTRRYGGTGLGLAISRKLAEIMGGTLTATSVEGEGSTFVLTLPAPLVDSTAPNLIRPVVEAGSLQGRSILAADDHEVNRRILKLLLEPHGCLLTLVENGQEAVDAASVEAFDAILMDMQMPVMDGLAAASTIRLLPKNSATPIIALTANAMDVHRAAWDEVGVYAFLTKPIDPVTLAQTLGQACATERLDEAAVA